MWKETEDETNIGFTLCALLLSWSLPIEAQQPTKIPRIGYLRVVGVPSTPSSNVEAFRQGLRDLGYVEGKDIAIEFRYAEGNQERIVAELVQEKVDVLILGDEPAIRAAKESTKSVPIVMVINLDPVATGLVDSLARPSSNLATPSGKTTPASPHGA